MSLSQIHKILAKEMKTTVGTSSVRTKAKVRPSSVKARRSLRQQSERARWNTTIKEATPKANHQLQWSNPRL